MFANTDRYACCECGKLSRKSEMVLVTKNGENLKQWIEQCNLSLLLRKRGNNFVCKSHLYEENSEKTESDFAMGDMEPGTSYPMEVKSEVEEGVEEVPMESVDLWQGDAKIEPTGEGTSDMSDYPFDMEQSSFSNYEETEDYKYTDDCQPTTSSAHIVNDPFSSIPLYYPEVADGQIMAFCVKHSSNTSGHSTLKCGLCPEEFFTMDTRPIRRHLRLKHVGTMKTLLQNNISRAPKPYEPMTAEQKMAADRSLCMFILKNGLPLKTVNDRNLEMLAFNMNSEYEMPSVDTLYEIMQEIADAKNTSKINKRCGPMTLTFDTASFNNYHYIAFTISFYRTRSEIQKYVFLRELDTSKQTAASIIKTIKTAVGSAEMALPIATVVTGNPEFEDALEDMGSFKQVMVCFSQNMNKFAEGLINHPIFATTLETLRHFIRDFPANRNLWNRFKSFIIKRRTYGEYPELDEPGKWFTTLDFMTKCLHMHRLFSEFTVTNTQLKYIQVEDNVNMVYLHSLLGLCKSIIKQMAERNVTIADIIPFIGEINSSLEITTSRKEVVDIVTGVFRQHLLPFVEQSDIHRFALYLHPIHHGTPILPVVEWHRIQESLTRQLNIRDAAEGVPMNRIGDMLGFPSLKETTTTHNEVISYAQYIIRGKDMPSPRLDSILEWWYRHSSKFPRLYKYARELLPIPAFSIDAFYYFGENGILTHSLQETEVSKRNSLLLASSELVDYHSKGNIVCKQICVKRKRDPSCPEDSWYAPLDIRCYRTPHSNNPYVLDYTGGSVPRPARVGHVSQLPHPTKKVTSTPVSASVHPDYQARVLAARPPPQVPPQRTLKQEIEKLSTTMPPKKIVPRTYVVMDNQPKRAIPPIQRVQIIHPTAPPQNRIVMPQATKRYYAVRNDPNGEVRTSPGAGPPSKFIRRVAPSNGGTVQTKKVYIVRQKTGQPQPPPS